MPVTNYYTVNGEIISESTDGVYLDYLTDALGSVTAKVDQTCTVVSTARYKPYGDLLSGTQYKLGWVGSQGYRNTGLKYSGGYVRARHFSTEQGQWTTADPLWPSERLYIYCQANSTSDSDPTGRAGKKSQFCCCCPEELEITNIQKTFSLPPPFLMVKACGHKFQVPYRLSYKNISGIKADAPCTLEWWESSLVKRNGTIIKRTGPENFNAGGGTVSPTFYEWYFPEIDLECVIRAGTLLDWPYLGVANFGYDDAVFERTLDIRIVIRAGDVGARSQCKCTKMSIERKFRQYLKLQFIKPTPGLSCLVQEPNV